jgi:hypothetical protein
VTKAQRIKQCMVDEGMSRGEATAWVEAQMDASAEVKPLTAWNEGHCAECDCNDCDRPSYAVAKPAVSS